ncbi:MAG: PASTA domain-containing protein [Clostridiales bacterium]|nr:PASTA domain-containing protein [Clostridiales bacterium]
MINTDDLCMSCMRDIGAQKQCPHCGFDADTLQIAPYLPIRTVIGNRYLVGKLLDYNGEGATYIGWDLTRKVPVNIRELFPDTLVTRAPNGKAINVLPGKEEAFSSIMQSFLELWRKLVRLRGLSALICAVDILEENNTAYTFYEYEESMTLREYLLSSDTGYLSWERVRQLFMPVLSTLGTLHSSGIIHRGLSPTTLFVGKDGKMKISGFCIGQARTSKSELNPQLFQGYAAIEQYGYSGQQGPWTDIYAFGAVMYRALIGTDPIDASIRITNDRLMVPGKFAEQMPAYFINGLVNSMQILPEDRTRNVEQLRAELSAAPAAVAASDYDISQHNNDNAPPARPAKKKMSNASVGIITAVSIIAVGIVVVSILAMTVFKDRLFKNNTEVTVPDETSVVDEIVVVPNFVGRRYTQISTQGAYNSKFKIVKEEMYDDKIAEGYVISQSIEANTSVKKGTEIRIFVSLGKEKIVLPKIMHTGMKYDDVYTLLTGLGFVCEKKENQNDGSHPEGEIISVLPQEELEYDKGTKVYITVWGAPPTQPSQEETTSEPYSDEEPA